MEKYLVYNVYSYSWLIDVSHRYTDLVELKATKFRRLVLSSVFSGSVTEKREIKMINEEAKGLDALKELIKKYRAEPIELYRVDFLNAVLNVIVDAVEKKRAGIDCCADVLTIYEMIRDGLMDSGDTEWKKRFEELKKPVVEKPNFYKRLEGEIRAGRFCGYHVSEEIWGIMLNDFESLCNEFEERSEHVSEEIPIQIPSEIEKVEEYLENQIKENLGCKVVHLKFSKPAIDEQAYEVGHYHDLGWFVFDMESKMYKECKINPKALRLKGLKNEKYREYAIGLNVIEPKKEGMQLTRYDSSVLDREFLNVSYERKALCDSIFKVCLNFLREKGFLKPRVEIGKW